MKILIHWIILAAALFAVPYIISGVHVASFLAAIVAGAILMFINTIVKPIVSVLTLPINIITLGLFSLVLNGLFFWFVANIISGFSVDNFKSAFLGALIVSIINWLGSKLLIRD